MSQGYTGRAFQILRNDVVIAAVRGKTATFSRDIIDRSDEEYDGWRHIDNLPESRSVQVSVSGLAKASNFVLLEDWEGDTLTDITIRFPDGTTITPDGAFLQTLDYVGEVAGSVQFNATFLFVGAAETQQSSVFPFVFLAVRTTGQLASSNNGMDWANPGTIAVTGAGTWRLAKSPTRILAIASNRAPSDTGLRRAYTDDGVNWTNGDAVVDSAIDGIPCQIRWVPFFGPNGRYYIICRQTGGSRGGIYHSDDGVAWTQCTYDAGLGSGVLDVQYMAFDESTERLVFMLQDATLKRFAYTDDGQNVIGGLGNFLGSSFSNQGDNAPRGMAFDETNGVFCVVGSSGSNFVAPGRGSTPDATTSVSGPSGSVGSGNAGSGPMIYVPTVPCVCGVWNDPGVSTDYQSYYRSIDGGASYGSVPNGAASGLESMTDLAWSEDLDLIVAVGDVDAQRSTDGINYTAGNAMPVGSTGWSGIIATR